MPGIVGLITEMPRAAAERQVRAMVASMMHEDFYTSGTWACAELGVYCGWVARRGSFDDSMPLRSEDGALTLLFSGEDFPDPDTKSKLRASGHCLAGEADYLVHVAEECENFPRSLNGRFHGLLVNSASGNVRLFNDRYGMHRIYWHQAADGFYFAAEAKALLAARPELRALSPQGLGEFITCGCTLENRSLFRDVQVLPPASVWGLRAGQVEKRATYFVPREWEEQPILDEESYYERLRDVFSGHLGRYFRTTERVGISLTGGLDSRMIMSWLPAKPGRLSCYSFGGPFRDCQDVRIARKVANICHQPHQTIAVGREFLTQFPQLAQRTVFLTDGCVEVKHAADLYANRIAAKIGPVRMTGNYGGEVMRRVRAFKPVAPAAGLFADGVQPHLDNARKTYTGLLDCHPLSFAVFRQAPWHHYSLLSLEQSQLSLRSPYLDNDFVQTVFQAPPSTLSSNDVCLRLIADGSPELRRLRTDRGLGGSLPRLLSSARQKWLEFTFKAEYAWDYGMPQPVARVDHALAALHLERLFLGRHKFYHYRIWYKNALAAYVREMLLDGRTLARPWLQRRTVEQIVEGHLRGGRNFTSSIHKLLSLELIHRQFVDGQ